MDQFETYYSEKLWAMIPEVYRHEDGLEGPNKGVLRGIVEVIAAQAAILRRSQDRLWDDQFIELCDEWAVPYIADLLATRLLSAQNPRGRRIDVAKTIYYRRRKGTPRILEELISDITGWDGKMTEGFQRLARARHALDPKPASLAGRFSGTMPGGTADLRNPRAASWADGPFEEYFHTPDMRRESRYGIHRLTFFMFPHQVYEVRGVQPFMVNSQRFTFDPSGRNVPLFGVSNRPDSWDDWHSAKPWELAMPISCRLLGHAEYRITRAVIQKLVTSGSITDAQADDLQRLHDVHFRDEAHLRAALLSLPSGAALIANIAPILRHALVADCGKCALLADGITAADDSVIRVEIDADNLLAEQTAAGNLQDWMAVSLTEKSVVIDPERGRLALKTPLAADEQLLVHYHTGFSANIGAGTYPCPAVETSEPDVRFDKGGDIPAANLQDGKVHQIDNSLTYGPIGNKLSITSLTLQAANGQRPFLRLDGRWRLETGSNTEATLVLDGLWIGGAKDASTLVTLDGDYERVIIRNCTFDPGSTAPDAAGDPIYPVMLRIDGKVEHLIIEASIMGPIIAGRRATIETACLRDSIVQSIVPTTNALHIATGVTELCRCTVLGNLEAHRLQATDSIVAGTANVLDTQTGCFRFSAAVRPPASRLPRPYEAFLFEAVQPHWFRSQAFGSPDYARLSASAPVEVQRGAESGSEMGAFSHLMNPVKSDGLRAKIEEYMPFGLLPQFNVL